MKPKLKPPGTKRLKLDCDMLLSTAAFKFNLRHCILAVNIFTGPAGAGAGYGPCRYVLRKMSFITFQDISTPRSCNYLVLVMISAVCSGSSWRGKVGVTVRNVRG